MSSYVYVFLMLGLQHCMALAETSVRMQTNKDDALEDELSLVQIKLGLQPVHSRARKQALESFPMADYIQARLKNMSKPISDDECEIPHPEDLNKPISLVLEENPGVEGYCYFNFAFVAYLGPYYVQKINDYVITPFEAKDESYLSSGPYLGHHKGPLFTFYPESNPDGVSFYADARNYEVDIPYCYALGLLKNQGLNGMLMSNPTAWRALSMQYCDEWEQEFNLTQYRQELTVAQNIQFFLDMAFDDGSPSRKDAAMNAMVSCAFGDEAFELSYCYSLGCVLPDGNVGTQSDCDYAEPFLKNDVVVAE
mmetsp:Transcript_62657/g.104189  ORF Transcript_62657/g.104189 Transcript_62657/m.104189 type:complete len:309 (+) Transcript_62657:77-1003(+)